MLVDPGPVLSRRARNCACGRNFLHAPPPGLGDMSLRGVPWGYGLRRSTGQRGWQSQGTSTMRRQRKCPAGRAPVLGHRGWERVVIEKAEFILSSPKSLMHCDVVEGHPLHTLSELKKGRQLGVIPLSACVGLLLPKRLVAIQRTSGRIWVLLEGQVWTGTARQLWYEELPCPWQTFWKGSCETCHTMFKVPCETNPMRNKPHAK